MARAKAARPTSGGAGDRRHAACSCWLAGPHSPGVRAVLMGGVAFAVLEGGGRSGPWGVLLLRRAGDAAGASELGLAWMWASSVSVAATAGLILTASDLEQALAALAAGWGRGPGWIWCWPGGAGGGLLWTLASCNCSTYTVFCPLCMPFAATWWWHRC